MDQIIILEDKFVELISESGLAKWGFESSKDAAELYRLLVLSEDIETRIDLMNCKIGINKALLIVKKEFKIQDTKTSNGNRIINLDPTTVSLLIKWQIQQKELFIKTGCFHKREKQLIFTNDTFRADNEYLYLTFGYEQMKKLNNTYPENRCIYSCNE